MTHLKELSSVITCMWDVQVVQQPITADEVRLICHWGFGCRLSTVTTATLSYQSAKAALLTAQEKAQVAQDALDAARDMAENMPEDFDLVTLCRRQHETAQETLAARREALAAKATAFFDLAGAAAEVLVEAMAAADWSAAPPALLEALSEPLSA